MSISKRDSEKMIRLAKEGKQISRIVADNFPNLGYWDVYFEVYGSGERSARGVKSMITSRLNKIVAASKGERKIIVEELHELVWNLYKNHKMNQGKLDKIRKALGE